MCERERENKKERQNLTEDWERQILRERKRSRERQKGRESERDTCIMERLVFVSSVYQYKKFIMVLIKIFKKI